MGKLKDWYIRSWKETLNNPMKELGCAMLLMLLMVSIGAIFAVGLCNHGEHLVAVGMSLVVWSSVYIIFRGAIYNPLKVYYEKYGKTGIGDEFEKEALKSGKPIRTVIRY